MKRILLVCLALVFIFSLAGAYAQDYETKALDEEKVDFEKTAVNKLGRGLVNTATCWAEIPAEVARISNEKDPVIGATLGVLQGTILTIVRGASGLFDILTSPFGPYDKPLVKPDYAVTRADKEIKDYLW